MMDDSPRPRQPGGTGLCPVCANVQVITSSRGSTFYLCRLSFKDRRFPKYPPQPVVRCAGYQDGADGGNGFTNGVTE